VQTTLIKDTINLCRPTGETETRQRACYAVLGVLPGAARVCRASFDHHDA